jgi:hypothetical protein
MRPGIRFWTLSAFRDEAKRRRGFLIWNTIAPHDVWSVRRTAMNSIIYLVGLIVVVLAILSFLGLR